MRAIFLAAALAVASPAAAEDAHVRALSAGYKAAFLCSGLFNANRPEAEIAADDLEGIYPDYQELVRTLPAKVDREAKTVSVAFDDRLPPRIAAWRPVLGCAQLPIGAEAGSVRLPTVAIRPPDLRARPWPDGDAAATAPAPAGLPRVVARAFEPSAYGGKTTAVVVVKDGRIVGERYGDGFSAGTPLLGWSITKSVTAALIGT